MKKKQSSQSCGPQLCELSLKSLRYIPGLEILIISPAFDFSLSKVNTSYMAMAFSGSTMWGAMSRKTLSCLSLNVNIFIMRAVWLHE